MRPRYVIQDVLERIIEQALEEDLAGGDATSRATIAPETRAQGRFIAKESGVLAGLEVAESVFQRLDPSIRIDWLHSDGSRVASGETFGRVEGNAIAILEGERLALNVMQRMSGIASATRKMVDLLEGSTTVLLDTRKTAPGLRILDKWAVLLGGGSNHRVGLFDMILIKENHIAAAGSLETALDRTAKKGLKVEIEVTSLAELKRVLDHGGADRVMLDNFVSVDADGDVDTSALLEAVRLVEGQLETEASGNITLNAVKAIAKTGVDFISSGALTHSVHALDLSLLVSIEE